jgi:TonB-linked SusC/RagA family outer membrane protein
MNLISCPPQSLRKKERGVLHQTLLVMRLIILLTILSCLKVTAAIYAQGISLNVKDAPISSVLNEIKQQSGYSLITKDDLLSNANKVTLSIKNANIKEALDACFRQQPLTYELVGRTIVVKEKPSAIKKKNLDGSSIDKTIRGTVTDSTGAGLQGAVIRVKGTDKVAIAGTDGRFEITNVPDGATLVFSMIGYKQIELSTAENQNNFINVTLKIDIGALNEVSVVSTGYQQIPKERVTGSFVLVNNATINRSVSTNILDRLNGIVPGLAYLSNSFEDNRRIITTNPLARNTNIRIRGVNTLSNDVSKDPLIVLDNFPYEGDLRNINPNDVESITILKDAAAASIWGARSGNGVIVITSKKGRKNQPLTIDFNSNLTIQNKPDLNYDQNYLSSTDFIDVEKKLFDNGFFDGDLTNARTRPVVSPVVELLNKIRNTTSPSEIAGYESQINDLRNADIRNDFDTYVYQKSIKQQYSLGLRGGTDKMTNALSFGLDKNQNGIVRNGFDRISVNSMNTYTPIKNLELTAGLIYTQSNTTNNTKIAYGSTLTGGKYGTLPYTQFAGNDGKALPVVRDYRSAYQDEKEAQGFLDWRYRPLDEIANGDDATNIKSFIVRTGIKYTILPFLKAEALFQNETQKISSRQFQSQDTYYTRNLINRFTLLNEDSTITNQFPKGGILDLGEYTWNSKNLRTQLYFDKVIQQKHAINAIAGAELRELKTEGFTRTSFGYDEQFGTAVTSLDYATRLSVNPNGTALLPQPGGNVTGILNRYMSYYANAGYSFDNRYSFTLSGRRDGANLFGAKTNNKITPLWSAGVAWNISNEAFYHVDWLPYLKFRTTYGYNGNVYNGSAYITGAYGISTLTGLPTINPNGITPPNPELRWEKIRNINAAIDFGSRDNRITGSVELYQKSGRDLIEPVNLPLSTGFPSYYGNAAATMTKGIDLTISTANINSAFKWNSILLLSVIKDKLTTYDVPMTLGSIQGMMGVIGKPLNSVYSYKWGGLDPASGDPMGYLNGAKSKDYVGIINNYNPDSLKYNGSSDPTVFGSIRNDFSFKGISLSVNIIYKFGYVFRRPSVSTNYQDLISSYGNSDYDLRWKTAGDERNTSVPSLVYPSDDNRNQFYQYSDVLVEKGDHIRLQDIRIAYDLKNSLKNIPFSALQIYTYASNIGIIWRANKHGIDPDTYPSIGSHILTNPLSISLGIKGTF